MHFRPGSLPLIISTTLRGGANPPVDYYNYNNDANQAPPHLPPELPPIDGDEDEDELAIQYQQQEQQQSQQPYSPYPGAVTTRPGDPMLPPPLPLSNSATLQRQRQQQQQQQHPPPPPYYDEPVEATTAEAQRPWDALTASTSSSSSSPPVDLSTFDKEFILKGLARLYRKKILPLELSSRYGHFHSPPLSPSDFEAPPTVLLLGQYR